MMLLKLSLALLIALSAVATSSTAVADLNQNSLPSDNVTRTSSTLSAAPKASAMSTEDAAQLKALVGNVLTAEKDGNTNGVDEATENVRRFMIKLKNKGVALKVNPLSFTSTHDLTKKIDALSKTKVAMSKGLKMCLLACAVVSNFAVEFAAGKNPSDLDLADISSDRPNVELIHSGAVTH